MIKIFILIQLLPVYFGIDINGTEIPQWVRHCNDSRPKDRLKNFLLCDPDHLLVPSTDIPIIHDNMKAGETDLNNVGGTNVESISIVTVCIKNITFFENTDHNSSNLNDVLEKRLVKWFNLSSEKSILIIVNKDGMEKFTEWYSTSFKDGGTVAFSSVESIRARNGKGLDFATTIAKSQRSACYLIVELYSEATISQSTYLWIILGILMIIGGTSFVCWVYNFYKTHPTGEEDYLDDDIQEVTMAENVLNPRNSVVSGDFEVASHIPVKTDGQAPVVA